MITVKEVVCSDKKARICSLVLRDLPDWFGIEEATIDYIEKSRNMPFFVACDADAPIGFVYLYTHNSFTCEVYCMGVLESHHRKGIGKMLISAAEKYARKAGTKFLTVKTLADTHPDEYYKSTRAFYLSAGFIPLEVFPDLWGKENPCLFLVKSMD